MAKRATDVQAKRLASIWVEHEDKWKVGEDGGYTDATTKALIKQGWLLATYETGKFPNGTPWRAHVISKQGFEALADYLKAMPAAGIPEGGE